MHGKWKLRARAEFYVELIAATRATAGVRISLSRLPKFGGCVDFNSNPTAPFFK